MSGTGGTAAPASGTASTPGPALNVDAPPPAGLTTSNVADRLRAEGPNVVVPAPPPSPVRRVGRQLSDPLIVLLLAAAAVTVVLGDYTDAIVIALVIVLNTTIGVVQEVRADRAVAALDQLAAPTARVVRDGVEQVVAAADLVREDLVLLQAGDVVPADVALTEANQLRLDEAAITGESVPVGHAAGDEVSAGTVVVAGRARGAVVRTGPASSLGRITALVAATRPGPTPLQRRLSGLGRVLGLTAVVLAAAVFGLGVATGNSVVTMAVTAVSLVVAAVPESLPAVVTLALALGARRMARSRAIPRRLHAVETLGSVTVIASDKTGTVTEGRMTVQVATPPAGEPVTVTGSGYAPTGRLVRDGREVAPHAVADLARAALLCNDASLAAPSADRAEWTVLGDPFEGALVAFAARCGLDPDAERTAWPRVDEEPFDQDTRRMTTVHRGPGGDYLIVCKGAPESVVPLLATGQSAVRADAEALAARGLRVLAIAAARRSVRPSAVEPSALEPLGVLGIGDPLRAEAADTAAAFDAAGIRLVLITGDHPATATAIGQRLGILAPGEKAVAGSPANRPPETGDDTNGPSVWARVRPEHKLDIIAGLQGRGHIVAMTGDGVNDAPAL